MLLRIHPRNIGILCPVRAIDLANPFLTSRSYMFQPPPADVKVVTDT